MIELFSFYVNYGVVYVVFGLVYLFDLISIVKVNFLRSENLEIYVPLIREVNAIVPDVWYVINILMNLEMDND